MTNSLSTYTKENRGRVLILFLLFLLSLYELDSAGLPGMAIVCIIPMMIVGVYVAFRNEMILFWLLFFINYFIMGLNRYFALPLPITAFTILPQIILTMVCIIDIRKQNTAKYHNLMLLALMIWVSYIFFADI